MRWLKTIPLLLLLLWAAANARAAKKSPSEAALDGYVARLPSAAALPAPTTTGSLWVQGSAFTQLARDYKSYSIGDVVTIAISENTVAQDTKSVTAQRSFSASSGLQALAGQINTAGVQQLFSPQSNQALTGKGQAASNTVLQTSLAGQVVAILSGGMVVIEAQRTISMNNEKQTIIVRGVARPGDISANNVVASTSLAHLEVEIKGKGVLSDANRQPNWLVRTLLRIVGF